MDIWWIPIAAGITDGFNPSIFAIAAVYLFIHSALEGRGFLVLSLFLISTLLGIFVVASALGLVALSSRWFNWILIILDIVLSGVFIYVGLQAFRQWQAWQKHQLIQPLTGQMFVGYLLKRSPFNWILPVFLGLLCAALSSQWAPNYYFAVLSSPAALPENEILVFLLMGVYTVVLIWPLWALVIAFNNGLIPPRIRPLITAGIFFIASTLVLLILK